MGENLQFKRGERRQTFFQKGGNIPLQTLILCDSLCSYHNVNISLLKFPVFHFLVFFRRDFRGYTAVCLTIGIAHIGHKKKWTTQKGRAAKKGCNCLVRYLSCFFSSRDWIDAQMKANGGAQLCNGDSSVWDEFYVKCNDSRIIKGFTIIQTKWRSCQQCLA